VTPLRPYYPQLDLDLGRLPAGSQPVETSEAAADKLSPEQLHKRRLSVLRYFASRGAIGATADEAVDAFGSPANSIAPRVTELASMGYLERTEARRKTRQGGSASVMRITEAGRRAI
jgi:hypothetical protein